MTYVCIKIQIKNKNTWVCLKKTNEKQKEDTEKTQENDGNDYFRMVKLWVISISSYAFQSTPMLFLNNYYTKVEIHSLLFKGRKWLCNVNPTKDKFSILKWWASYWALLQMWTVSLKTRWEDDSISLLSNWLEKKVVRNSRASFSVMINQMYHNITKDIEKR